MVLVVSEEKAAESGFRWADGLYQPPGARCTGQSPNSKPQKSCLSRAAAAKKKLSLHDEALELFGKICLNLVNRHKYTLHLAFCNCA